MRFTILVGLLIGLLGNSIEAQEFGNANLNLGLYPNELVRCYVKADKDQLTQFIYQHNGHLMNQFRGWTKIELTGNELLEMSKKSWCTSIRIEHGVGAPLGDTSKVNSNTIRVHNGEIARHGAFTGEGVVMGFVDTGIDFTHPDFKNEDGSTRVYKIWDHLGNTDSTLRPSFGYGEVYDSAMINAGNCPHLDNNGHGTQVSGIGAGNGNSVPDSIADYSGHAPNSLIMAVNTDFNRPNWTLSIAESIEWMFDEADKLGLPCVVNLSVGTYSGSHDGLDLAAQIIDSLTAATPGRLVVCAAGNAGTLKFHLKTEVNSNTRFTYFEPNPNSNFGNAIFIEAWGDTADMKNMQFGFGYTDTTTWKDSIYFQEPVYNRLDTLLQQNIGGSGQLMTFAEIQGGTILYQVLCVNPNAQHFYKLTTTGTGAHDIWSTALLGWSNMISTGLPNSANYPQIQNYTFPDSLQSIVSSWNCSPNVLSVANYNNRFQYLNANDSLRITVDLPIGGKGATSSIGPNRLKYTKPDIAAPGNYTLGAGSFQNLNNLRNIPSINYRLAKGGYHYSNGGTSMASPVVAGIGAMYLEKCPNATSAEIRNAILTTAFTDVHTGVVPNVAFGVGKVDALAVLSTSNINDSLMVMGSTIVCDGDSVEVGLSTSHNSMVWSDGFTNQTRIVNSTDSFYVQLANTSGCKGITDTVTINKVPLPNVNIVAKSDSFCLDGELVLKGAGASKYLWNTGDTLDSLIVSVAGVYWTEGIDTNGCSFSDTVSVKQYLCRLATNVEQEKMPFKLFPNPVDNLLTLNWDIALTDSLDLRWLDLSGKPIDLSIVKNSESKNGSIQIHTNQLQKGIYLLEIQSSTNIQYFRIVKN